MREGYSRGSCVYQNKERNRAAYPLWVYAVQERKRAMERLTHPRSSGIKTGYWSPNKKDELIERLAAYEDTGLTPKEIERLKEQYRWIPVEERPPEEDTIVLLTVSGLYSCITFSDAIELGNLCSDGEWFIEGVS
jgi:hypothetical protein|nr:MAG TPA: Protein of unknown function (DUF551) [Caudoviricetes sp.]